MRKIKVFLAMVLCCVLACQNTYQISAEEKDCLAYTMDEVKQILENFLNENHPTIQFGTAEYMEYLLDQLMHLSDEKLKAYPKCDLILDYASLYLYEIKECFSANQLVAYNVGETDNYNTFKDKTMEELIMEVKKELQETRTQARDNIITKPSQYNKETAIAYARKWANSYNPDYNTYIKDCTNFVSQILFTAGLYGTLPWNEVPKGIYETQDYWYFIQKGQMSTSFIRIEDFYPYWTQKVRNIDCPVRWIAEYWGDCGDVIVLKRSSTGVPYHAIFISDKIDGELYYCAHTNNRLDYPFSYIDEDENDFQLLYFTYYVQ